MATIPCAQLNSVVTSPANIIPMLLHLLFESQPKHEKNSKSNDADNARNGKTSKTVKTGNGEITIDVPRDRKSEFEPALIPKRRNTSGP
jgi:transposase-like protein